MRHELVCSYLIEKKLTDIIGSLIIRATGVAADTAAKYVWVSAGLISTNSVFCILRPFLECEKLDAVKFTLLLRGEIAGTSVGNMLAFHFKSILLSLLHNILPLSDDLK